MSTWELPIDALRKLRWKAKFHKTLHNPTAPGPVDMYLMVDDETGEGIVSVGVPQGRNDIAEYIAKCCSVGI